MPAHEPTKPSVPVPSGGEAKPPPAVAVSGGLVNVDPPNDAGLTAVGAPAAGRETAGQSAPRTLPEIEGIAPLQPHRFPKYELIERIGAGGMGTVWKARDALLKDREYALKVISSGRLAGPTLRKLFLDEMTILTKLGEDHPHPNIVQIRWHGESNDGELGFAMSYESGGDLAALIDKQGPQDARYAADLVRQAAEAVAHAHRHDVIHCDLKPHNILLSKDGTPKVTDFGLARLETKGKGAAARGEPVGTPSYMAPEQAEGRDDQIGRLTDVYGLGAVLYHLLTGKPPHEGATVEETLRQVREETPARPRDLNPRIPRRLEAICLKCLEKAPRQRFESAAQAAAALQAFVRPWWKRHWRRLAAGAALLLLGGWLVFWFGYEGPHRDAENIKKEEAKKAESMAKEAESVAKEADSIRDKRPGDARDEYQLAQFKYQALLDKASPFLQGADLPLKLARVQTYLGRLQEDARDKNADKTLGDAQAALEALCADDPGRPEYRVLLAEVHHDRGVYFDHRQEWSEAEEHLRKGLVIRQGLTEQSRDADFKPRLTQCYEFLDGSGRSPAGEEALARDLALSYGWLGDVQQALGQDPSQSYDSAGEIRLRLFEQNPNAETLYLHARDFGNNAGYLDRKGEVDRAIDKYRERLKWYDDHKDISLADLPQNYRNEPAETRMAVAELELDRDGSREQAALWLGEAEGDYRRLLEGAREQDRAPISADLAHLYVVRAKLARAQKSPGEALTWAEKAEQEFASLHQQGKAHADDYYYWAVACAVKARLTDDPVDRVMCDEHALMHVGSAFDLKFNQRNRLERDRSLLQPGSQKQKEEFDELLIRAPKS